MHGMLFHPDTRDIGEDLTYARWLGGGVVRVFATDSSGIRTWDGTRVGTRIAEIAPMLRASHLRLIVALVNNHAAVPGEASGSVGWMDNYIQLLLPFYTTTWRGAYYQFVHDLISTVQSYNATDVVYAWELGNELHTPRQPEALMPFVTQAAAYVRQLDPATPVFPGTMGANHVEPDHPNSAIARWLYCEAPVDAYTLHAYDWVSRQRPGDMPINWDLDNIVSQPCDNGRRLPVIVEELGTSRALPGVYTADDEAGRLAAGAAPDRVRARVPAGRRLRRVERREPTTGGPHVRRHAPRTDLLRQRVAGRRIVLRPSARPAARRALPARKRPARLALRPRRREQCLDRFTGHAAERRDRRAG